MERYPDGLVREGWPFPVEMGYKIFWGWDEDSVFILRNSDADTQVWPPM